MTDGISKLEAFFSSATGQAVLDAFVHSTPALLLVVDSDGKLLRESRYSAEFRGQLDATQPRGEGMSIAQFLETFKVKASDGRPLEPKDTTIFRALNGEQVEGHETIFSGPSGESLPVVSNGAPIKLPDGEVIGAISTGTDLRRYKALERELRAAIAEKEMLYRELAHRVKNHLQVISGLIKLEADQVAGRMTGRLTALRDVYDRMVQAESGGRIPVRAFTEDLVKLYRSGSISVDVTVPEELSLSPEAAGPFGMLINEAVANSYKHAFADRAGRIEVSLRASAPGRLALTIADDGRGWAATTDQPSQGMKLMRVLAQQLGGELETSDRIGGGAQIVVHLPDLSEQAPREPPRPEGGDVKPRS